MLTDLGAPDTVARAVTAAAALAILYLAWRRRSLTLAIAAALVLSPSSGATSSCCSSCRSGSPAHASTSLWLLPLGMWLGDGTFNGATWQTVVVLALGAAIVIACERGEERADHVVSPSRIPASTPI